MNGYGTPSDDESTGSASPMEEAPAGAKRRLPASGATPQREAKSRRTGEAGGSAAPGQSQGPNAPRGGGGGRPPGYDMGVSAALAQSALMNEDGYGGGRHGAKREEYADQKLMDELKKELGDPLAEMPKTQSSASTGVRSPPANK